MTTWLAAKDATLAAGTWTALEPDAEGHARVLRLREGERVVLFDGRGRRAEATLKARDGRAGAEITSEPTHVSAPRLTLVQAVPKGDKLDDVVRMATEIGVSAIHLALTERCVARPRGERADRQVARLARIAWAAAAQAEQAWVPDVLAPSTLDEVVARAPLAAARVLAAPRTGSPIGSLGPRELEGGAWLLVGPEGGLTPEEEATLVRAGWRAVSLATGVLRTETAAAVLLGALVARA